MDTLPEWWFIVPWDLRHAGGVNQVVLNLYRNFEIQGTWRPRILILDWECRRPVESKSAGLPVIRWRVRSPVDGPGCKGMRATGMYLAWVPAGILMWRKLIDRRVKHVINIHYPLPSAHLFHIARRIDSDHGRLILSYHGTDVTSVVEAKAQSLRAYRKVMMTADRIVACSHSLAKRIIDFNTSLTEKVDVVYNGIGSEFAIHCSSKNDGDVNERVPVILNIGSFDRVKGQHILLRATAILKEGGAEFRLLMVGRRGPALGDLLHEANELGISDRVEYHTDIPHTQIGRFYRDSDLFVLPSQNESFPLVLLEAGGYGLPVVATRVGGIPEIIDDGYNGLLVPPEEPNTLASAIRKLLKDRVLARSMGEQLRKKVMSEFTWHAAAEKYMKIAAETMNAG